MFLTKLAAHTSASSASLTDNGTAENSGTLDVSGKDAGQRGGTVVMQGKQVGMLAGSRIDASGNSGGGTVKIGGGRKGQDSSVRNASATYMDADASIDVSAINRGSAGTAILWSNDYTAFNGRINATGGTDGDGRHPNRSAVFGWRSARELSDYNNMASQVYSADILSHSTQIT